MRWEDERYVRLYTRDTIDWHFLSFEAQGLLTLILRKVDRAGIMDMGRHGKKGVAAAVGHPSRLDIILPALEELLSDGVAVIQGTKLVLPNFIEAQEAKTSDAQRKRDQRERDRDLAMASGDLQKPENSQNNESTHELKVISGPVDDVTQRDKKSQVVTSGHTESQTVTPSQAQPSLPSLLKPAKKTSPPEAAEPGWQELVDALFQKFIDAKGNKPNPKSRQFKALKELRARVRDDAEIIVRWERGLRGQFKERVDTFVDLDERWDALAGTGPPQKERDWSKGRVGAEEIDKSKLMKTGTLDGF